LSGSHGKAPGSAGGYLLRGDKMTADQFKEMLRYVKTNKRKAAEDTLASYAERSTEQL
jgi:hypothetical protein